MAVQKVFTKLKKGDFGLEENSRSGRPVKFDRHHLKMFVEIDACHSAFELA